MVFQVDYFIITPHQNTCQYFQGFHPLITSVIFPSISMIWLNCLIILRIKARRVRRITSTLTRNTEIVQVYECELFVGNVNLNKAN